MTNPADSSADPAVACLEERFNAAAPPGNIVPFLSNGVYGLMVVPWCPHEGCGWSMPQLWCPEHGNFGMTFLSARVGAITYVKAALA